MRTAAGQYTPPGSRVPRDDATTRERRLIEHSRVGVSCSEPDRSVGIEWFVKQRVGSTLRGKVNAKIMIPTSQSPSLFDDSRGDRFFSELFCVLCTRGVNPYDRREEGLRKSEQCC